MPANNGPGGRYYLDGEEPPDPSLVSRGESAGVSEVKLADEVMGGIVSFSWDRPATLWRFPLQTVSQSEAGWEKTYQSSVLTPVWPLSLESGAEWTVRLVLGVSV
jgi:alpha-amylase